MTGNRKYLYVDKKNRLRARVVMERFLGRPLSCDEVVHHINGNVEDDRIENLQIMDRKTHSGMRKICSKPPKTQPAQPSLTIEERREAMEMWMKNTEEREAIA